MIPKMPSPGDGLIPSLTRTVNSIIKYLPSLTVNGNTGSIGVNRTTHGAYVFKNQHRTLPPIYHQQPSIATGNGIFYRCRSLTSMGAVTSVDANFDWKVLNVALEPGTDWITITNSQGAKIKVGAGLMIAPNVHSIQDTTDTCRQPYAIGDYISQAIGLNIACDNNYISGWFVEDKTSPYYGRYNISWCGPQFPSGWTPTVYYPGTAIQITSSNVINLLAENERGTLVFTDSDNNFRISGLFYGDAQTPNIPSSSPDHWMNENFYNTIYSYQYQSQDARYVYFSIWDLTDVLSCNPQLGIVQDSIPIYNADQQGERLPLNGVNHYQTQLSLQPKYLADLNVLTGRPNTGSKVLCSNNGTMYWGDGGGSPTPAGSGMPWPNYANLDNSTGNVIMNYTRYQAGAGGGWLRISYKGQMTDDCYYVKIGPDGTSDPTIGLWRVQTGCGYYGQIGNTWLLPVPPNNYIYVSFPNSVATAWFDSSLSPDSPPPIPPSAHSYPDDINRNFVSVNDLKSQAERYYQECIGYSDYNDANEYAEYAEDCATDADRYATDSEEKNAVLVQYGINDYTTKVTNTRNNANLAEGYALQARQYADSLPH